MDVPTLDVRRLARIDTGEEADALASAAFDRVLALLDTLSPADWDLPTDYRGWTVRETVAHLVGSASAHASVLESMKQNGYAEKQRLMAGDSDVDAWAQAHLDEYAAFGTDDLLFRLRTLAPRAVGGRLRRVQWFGSGDGGRPAASSSWADPAVSLVELSNVTLARDVWMHTLDLSRTVGREVPVASALDERLLVDIVAEWCERHGQPVDLDLTGRLHVSFRYLAGGQHVRIDGLDFCRIVTGRQPLEAAPQSDLLLITVGF